MLLPFLLGLALAIAIALLRRRFAGFDAQRPADYAGKGPLLDPTVHLAGPLLCEGVIYGPTGRVASRFVAEMQGEWRDGQGVLTERFRYDSGMVQDRRWDFRLSADGALGATAADVPGGATGALAGSAMTLRYRIRLHDDAGGHVLDVNDWMYLLDNGTIINRSQFRKYGLKVAELVATLRRIET